MRNIAIQAYVEDLKNVSKCQDEVSVKKDAVIDELELQLDEAWSEIDKLRNENMRLHEEVRAKRGWFSNLITRD